MRFVVLPSGRQPKNNSPQTVFLVEDEWDDWFKYSTLYLVYYVDSTENVHEIGATKIGQFSMTNEQRRPSIPKEFPYLPDQYFSLGQDDTYYQNLQQLPDECRIEFLESINDLAYNIELFDRALTEDVTRTSLLRFIAPSTVRNQFHRLSHGGVRLTEYYFSYEFSKNQSNSEQSPKISFAVDPESDLPMNIHVLIGRNGVGKTFILDKMSKSLVHNTAQGHEYGRFINDDDYHEDVDIFSALVMVSFSAFDQFEPITVPRDRSDQIYSRYIGLKKVSQNTKEKENKPKDPSALTREFGDSLKNCLFTGKQDRWYSIIRKLYTDPVFSESEVAELTRYVEDEEELRKRARKTFNRLSSGHKIVLLTLTRLVETVQERTLVLLDEPESHLHPPLLATFVRALSDLLIDRNGVAIVATHSPVVLQEVPRKCVWKVTRSGRSVDVQRPVCETFGENVGILTHEVFGLEVTDSGFHSLLRHWANELGDYEKVLKGLDYQVGHEGCALLNSLVRRANQTKKDLS